MKVGQRYQNSSKVMLGMAPSQDASDHQDSYISTRESQPKPNFTTIASWEGATPKTFLHGMAQNCGFKKRNRKTNMGPW